MMLARAHNRDTVPLTVGLKVKNVIQPMFISNKLNEDLNVQEIKPTNVLFMFQCNLCDTRYNYGIQSVPPASTRLMVADRNRHPFTNTL